MNGLVYFLENCFDMRIHLYQIQELFIEVIHFFVKCLVLALRLIKEKFN